MSLVLKICCLCLFWLSVSCQFNMKVTDDENKFSPDRVRLSNFYMHNSTGIESDKIDVYLDKKRINLEKLDVSGIKLKPGKHQVDVIHKKSREPADHFEFEIPDKESQHMYLCEDSENSEHFSLVIDKKEYCKDQKVTK